MVQCIGNRPQNSQSLLNSHGCSRHDQLLQRTPRHQFHHQILKVTLFPKLVNGNDIRMREPSRPTSLSREAQPSLRILIGCTERLRTSDLDRDGTSDAGVQTAEHHSHRTPAQFPQHLVRSNLLWQRITWST